MLNNKVKILKLEIVPAGSYCDQHLRPFESNVSPMVLNELDQIMHTQSGSHGIIRNPTMISSVAGDIMRPQAAAGTRIEIPNGWSQSRWTFRLELEILSSTNHSAIQIIQGYTDYADTSFSGLPDPNTTFHINSVTKAQTRVENTPFGVQHNLVVQSSDHVIQNNQWGNFGWQNGNQSNSFAKIRPTDVYTHMAIPDQVRSSSDVFDGATGYTGIPVLSRRTNNLSSDYLSNVINGYLKSTNQPGTGDTETLMGTAIGHVAENTFAKDVFIRTLAGFVSETSTPTTFKLFDLSKVDNTFNHNNDPRIVLYRENSASMLDYRNYTNHWGGSDRETLSASIVSTTLPTIMMKFGISKVSFIATNETREGPKFIWSDIQSFGGSDPSIYISAIEAAMQVEIFDLISDNNVLSYNIEVEHVFTMDMQLRISINGAQAIPYVSPTFADATFTPIISDSMDRLHLISHDLENVINHVANRQQVDIMSISNFSNDTFSQNSQYSI